MSSKARYWRADGGYQTVPDNLPPPPLPPPYIPMQQQPTTLNMFYFPTQGGWLCQPTSWLQAPVPLPGLCTPPPPPPYAPRAPEQPPAPPAPPPQCCQPPLPSSPSKEKRSEAGKKEDTKASNPTAPPTLPQGANYMFDREHTLLNIFRKAAPIWTEKYRTEKLKFKMFKVSINFTVKMVIENTLKKGGDECHGWAVTEAVERGDGCWDKGSTIDYDSDKSNGTLKNMGWSSKRGDALPPVWLVVHKVDFK